MPTGTQHRRAVLWHLPLALLGATMLLPLVFMFSTALSAPGEAMRATDALADMLWPRGWRWGNFVEVWRVVPFLRYYFNSLLVAGCVTAGQVSTSAMAAFAFSRLRWPGRDRVFLAYLATMMVPHSVTMIPNFIAMKAIPSLLHGAFPSVDWLALRHLTPDPASPVVGHLAGLDSYFALIVPGMFSAYGTFLLRQFFLGLPRELDEAATIDGCGYFRLFWSVLLPLARPGLATLTIFTFNGCVGQFSLAAGGPTSARSRPCRWACRRFRGNTAPNGR